MTDDEIHRQAGMPLEQIREALASLEQPDPAASTADEPTRHMASSPGAVEAMIANQLWELRAAQSSLDRISSRHRAEHLARETGATFEIVHGREALWQRSTQMLHTARLEALNMIKPPIITIKPQDRVVPSDHARGRLIFETEALEHPGAFEAVEQGLRPNDEVRVHPELPAKMLIVDRSLALVPLAQRDTTPVGVLIHESAVLDALIALFDYVWAASVRLHVDNINSPPPAADSPLSAEDRRLLSLLLSGLTDDAIADHFRISAPTVQRKVHGLMEQVNVRTRMQLAWEAARQGWV